MSWARVITRAVRASVPRAGANTRIHRHGTGTSIDAISPHRSQPKRGKFEVYITGAETSTEGYTNIAVKVAFGKVYLTESWTDTATIDGLDDTEFTLAEIGDAVWIRMSVTSEGDVSLELECGAAWAEYPAAFVKPGDVDDQTQTWWQLLAIVRTPRDGELPMKLGGTDAVLDQVTTGDRIVRTCCAESEGRERIKQLFPL